MCLLLFKARESDGTRVDGIHMAAFSPNLLLRVQFPMAAFRAELGIAIAGKALADIEDPYVLIIGTSFDVEYLEDIHHDVLCVSLAYTIDSVFEYSVIT